MLIYWHYKSSPLRLVAGHLQVWGLLGSFSKWRSIFPRVLARTPGCRITVLLSTLLQFQPGPVSSPASCCFQQLYCVAVRLVGFIHFPYSFLHRWDYRHQGRSVGCRYQVRRLMWQKRLLWCEAVTRQCITELFGSISAVVSFPPIVNPESA